MASRPPEPPSDLVDRRLPLRIVAPGQVIHRIHRTEKGGKFFGRRGIWRFDSPDRRFGTLYGALSERACFVETLLRGSDRFVAQSEIEVRSFCRLQVLRDIKLVTLHGPHLAAVAASAAVTAGPYALCQRWSRAIHSHPDQPDGIFYRSNYDNDEFALVLFDRAADAIDAGTSVPIMHDPILLGRILDRYRASMR